MTVERGVGLICQAERGWKVLFLGGAETCSRLSEVALNGYNRNEAVFGGVSKGETRPRGKVASRDGD